MDLTSIIFATLLGTVLGGFLFLFTGACLGSLPMISGCRRSNTFAVILFPMMLFFMDWYQPVVNFLGFF